METIFGAILWVLANAVYVDMRRRGARGFKRLCAFWMGWPGTLVGMLSVDEESQPTVRGDDSDLRGLVLEIRRDRLLRAGEPLPPAPGGDEGDAVGGAPAAGDTTREEEDGRARADLDDAAGRGPGGGHGGSGGGPA